MMDKNKQRKLAKKNVLLKIVAEGLVSYSEALKVEVGCVIPIFSEAARINTKQRIEAVTQIPYKHFTVDGRIDKRRQRRFSAGNKHNTRIIRALSISIGGKEMPELLIADGVTQTSKGFK